jgi:hypothetical protein
MKRPAQRTLDDAVFAVSEKRRVPFEFVLDELEELSPYTKPMFGCTAIYVPGDDVKIVLVLRDRGAPKRDDGVWVATTQEHHASLRKEIPCLRSIELFGPGETGWQVIPKGTDDFEQAVMHACALIRRGDARIGKVPKRRPTRRKRA